MKLVSANSSFFSPSRRFESFALTKMNNFDTDCDDCDYDQESIDDASNFVDDKVLMDGEEINIFDFGVVDVEAETESMRQESQVRLRTKSHDLKRFHDKICVRVTERERQNRREAQRAQQYLEAKCAKMFTATTAWQKSNSSPPARASTRPYFQELLEQKKAVLKDCPLTQQIEKVLRADSQIREELLRSTEISRSEVGSETSEDECDQDNNKPAESPVLLPEQRVALYATVRRQYMAMNRARAQSSVWQTSSKPSSRKVKSPLANASVAAAVESSRARRKSASTKSDEDQVATSAGVKIVDMTSGCEVRSHRQTTTSTTPWRKKSAKASKAATTATEHERFLRALQAQLEIPSLCSCARDGSSSVAAFQPCANNCALYNQPKKREKLLTSVYKQQQLDAAATKSTATSPRR